ncbi:hypothetical protein ACWNYQ_00810 [Candidatus Vidania fulgoroideorum]
MLIIKFFLLDLDKFISIIYFFNIEKYLKNKYKEFYFRNLEKNCLLFKNKNFYSSGGGYYTNYLNLLNLFKNESIIYNKYSIINNRSIILKNSINKLINKRIEFLKFQYSFKYDE